MEPAAQPGGRIVAESLSVRYGNGVLALNKVDLSIGPGLFGLLGPNGAGKTTLMRTLSTLQQPTSGRVSVFGCDAVSERAQIRRNLGYLPQDFQSYPQLRVWEALDFYGILNGISRARDRANRMDEVMHLAGLINLRRRKVGQLSGGMLRRLGVAQALLNDPGLLILDKPTVGLDPAERNQFRTFLAELSRNRTVILSTHIVPDISASCEHLAILHAGEIRFQGSRDELLNNAAGRVWRVLVSDSEYESFRQEQFLSGMTDKREGIELRVLAAAPENPSWESIEPTLEDAYLWLLGPTVFRNRPLQPEAATIVPQ